MLFTQKTLTTLEYDKIVASLAAVSPTKGAASMALSLIPTDDYDTIIKRQRRTEDAKRLINAKGYPSFSAPESVVAAAERAYKGAILSVSELLDIASLLSSVRSLQDYIKVDKLFDTTIDELFARLLPSNTVEGRMCDR